MDGGYNDKKQPNNGHCKLHMELLVCDCGGFDVAWSLL